MPRVQIVLLLAISLQACSWNGGLPFADVLFPPTNTPAPSLTATNSPTPTRTPRPTLTPTFTVSPTIVHFPTQDPNLPTATFVPVPIIVGPATLTPFAIPNPVLQSTADANPGPGFSSVTVSLNKMYWGVCKNNKTTITAVVEDRQEVLSVVIFVRVKSAKKEDYTPWTTGDVMAGHGDGSYTYVLRGINIYGHNHYRDSWVHFQLVATDAYGEEVGRTQIYQESIHLSPCM